MGNIRVIIQKPVNSGGGGAVDSVNGKVGVVVLDGTDIPLLAGTTTPTVTGAIADLSIDINTKVQSVTGDGVNNTDPLNPVLSYPTPDDIGALKQGVNNLTQDLELKRTGTTKESEIVIDDRDIGIRSTDINTGAYSEVFVEEGAAYFDSSDSSGNNVGLETNITLEALLFNNKFGNGTRFNDRTVDDANTDFETDDNNLLCIGKAKENLPSKTEVVNHTSAFTVPNDTDNKYFTLKNATNQNVTIESSSFSRIGAYCSVSTNGAAGFSQILAGTDVVLLDDNNIATDTVLQKGLMCVDITGSVVTVEII